MRRRSLALVLCALALPACVWVPRRSEERAHAPSFRIIDSEDLRFAMWKLAYHVNELDLVLRSGPALDAEQRAAVLRILDEMTEATESIRGDRRFVNHPVLRDHLDHFRRDLALARAGAEAEPPSYVLAAYASGTCLICHGEEEEEDRDGAESRPESQ